MSVPCTQESTISHISKTLDRMERSQESIIDLLRQVASQDARISSLEEHKDRCNENADILFERVRDLELNQAIAPQFRQATVDSIIKVTDKVEELSEKLEPISRKIDKLNRFFYVTTHKYALWSYGLVLALIMVGSVMDIIYHSTTLKAIWYLFKGV